MTILTIDGANADDSIVVTATGADSGSYSINGGPTVAFSGITQLVVTGGAGNDTLTIVNPTDGLFAPVNGISFDGGGQPADTLEILGGVASELTYTAGATRDAGTLVHAGDAGTQTINFAGIAPITDTVAAATLVIKGTAGNDVIQVTDGGLVNGQQTTEVSAATFESIRFANKTTVTIDGNGGSDTLNFNNPTVAAGLVEMDVTNVGAITQTGAVNYTNLSLNNVGLVGLSGNNDVTHLAAKVTVPGTFFTFHDVDDITLTSVGGVNGISVAGSLSVTTTNGAITVVDTAAAADVSAVTTADLVAGSAVGADFAVQLSAGANVTGATGVRLKGDNIDIASGATVNAGTGTAFLETFRMGTHIDLGGADGFNTLGLTDTELDSISAGTLRIGDGTAGTISFVSEIAPAGVNQLELNTGADIQDNHVGTDVMVARLTLNAFDGIGVTGASAGIDTDVALIEGGTAFGGMNINNVGAITVGGVSDNFLGLWVFGSGDLTLTAGGTINLADQNGAAAVHGGSQGGNVFLSAHGAAADIIRTEGADAILAQEGSITAVAGRDIILGTGAVNPRTDVEASGNVTLSAGRDIIVSGQADIVADRDSEGTGGGVTATAGRNISLGGFATIGADGNGGGDVVLTTGANGRLTLGSLGLNGPALYSDSGDLILNADRMAISLSTNIAAAQSVTLQPVSTGWAVNLGSSTDTAASTLELWDGELDRIATPILRIGSTAMTGDLTVSQAITADGNYDTLSLRTGGGIVDGVAGPATEITVDNLALRASTGIGHSDFIRVAVSNLAFSNSGTGDVNLVNASSLTLAAVDGLAGSSEADGWVQVNSHGAMTVATNVTASGLINLIAEDTPGAGDDITVLAGTTIRSTAGSIQLAAGDNVTAQAGSSIQSDFLLVTYVDSGSADAGIGGSANINGTVLATSGTNFGGNNDNDVLNGTVLTDVLDGGTGADLMRGGLGNDIYYVDNIGDAVIESAGQGVDRVSSTIDFNLPDNVENLILFGIGNLQGYGNDLANVITGNDGSNLLDGRGGADAMAGGVGNDVYFVDNVGDSVTENAGEGNDAVFASAHFALSANLETLILQGAADLQGYGNDLTNSIIGNAGNNLLNGGANFDTMAGGAGNDTYFVDNSADVTIEKTGEGNDAVLASANYGLMANVETLVLLGTADLQGYGNTLANQLFGNTGNNLLDGGAGGDAMAGGAGNDTYFADNSSDAVIESAGEGNDAVFASVDYALAANVETLVLQGMLDLQGYGNTLANALFGNGGNNLLDGRGGADVMTGGAGNDTYFVDDGFDVVIENPAEGNDAIFTSAHFILPANVETLVLQGAAALNGTGNALANAMFGNSADNVLDGQGGADMLSGNAGNDTFVFNVGQGNGDTIVDFAGNGAGRGDALKFVGYGAGATFTNIDATHWQVNYNGGTSHEVIAFMNGAAIDATDVLFA